jgi:hypothetical protein
MVMESVNMVDGDGVGDDGCEDSVEIPLSDVESRMNLTPKIKILVVVICLAEKLRPPVRIGFRGI